MKKHIRRGHFTLLLPTALLAAVVLTFWNPFSFSEASTIQYYGHYFIEDPAKNHAYIHEVKNSTNFANVRYDNGSNNRWDPMAAARLKNAGTKVMLQIPFGTDSDQTLFVDSNARQGYLNQVKEDMLNTDFIPSLAYIAISEEWYGLVRGGYYDAWPIFQGKTAQEKLETTKYYLEQIIMDVKAEFPGVPTVIVENVFDVGMPSNLDVVGVDAYYIPDHQYCSSDQKAKFDREVLPWFDRAALNGKPLMMVAPSFIAGSWKMLSECQMQWYADLALSGTYDIRSFLWFLYADTDGVLGVRSYPVLVEYQKAIGCQILGSPYCEVPASTPLPPVTHTINLQANNGQYVVAEGNGGEAINANRDQAYAWETFKMIDLNGGQLISGDVVGIRTEENYYFRAEGGGGSSMDATAQALGPWETFIIEDINKVPVLGNNSQVSLRTYNGTNFVVAEDGGGREVAANRTAAYAWETFILKILGQ